jgi:hypothetical protein
MLDASSPTSQTLIAGQAVATLAIFKITNMGSTPAKVTNVTLTRTGVSADTTISNIYLYNGATRITDAATVASGIVTFNDTAGIVTIPAGSSIMLAARADIAASTNGQTIGVMLTSVTADGGSATGVPVSGAQHTIAAAPSGMTTADFTTAAATPAANSALDPQNDFTAWQENLTIGSRDAKLSSIRLRQIGSVTTSDLKNFRFMVDGVQQGATVDTVDSNGYVTFIFATPLTLKTGTRVLKLVTDIIGGSNRTMQFSLRQAGDAEIWDSQLNVTILPTAANAAFAAVTSGLQTISVGTLTITKTTDSPSGNIVNNASSITYAKFKVRAQGERMKVESLRISHTAGDTNATWFKIRNGALFLNGAQIGSTADICEDTVNASCTTAYTQYNLGSSMVLEPGVDYALEVRGDVYNNGTTGQLNAGTTTVVNIASQTSNIQRLTSLSYTGNSAASGNSLTVAAGSMILSKYSAYADQTVTVPQTALKLGEYRLTAGTSEGVNLDTITVVLSGQPTNVTNLYVVYGTKTTTSKATGAATQSWSINEPLAANATMNVAVYGTLSSATTGIISASTTISGTSQTSGAAVTSATAVAGQLMTVGTGSVTAVVDASTPASTMVVANSRPKVASFKFTSTNDAFTVTQLFAKASTTADGAAISSLDFQDGATLLKSQPLDGTYATTSGLSLPVAANTSKVIDVYANVGSIGTNAATTSANLAVILTGFETRNSNGVASTTQVGWTALAGNNIYAFKTKPTISNVALPSTILTTGNVTVAKFTITADAGGTVAWRKLVMNVASSTGTSGTNFQDTAYNIYDAANDSVALSGMTTNVTPGAGTTVTFTSAGTDQEVSGSKTYVVKATIGGTVVTNSSFSHNISTVGAYLAPNTYTSASGATNNFVWSDESATNHSGTTADWMGDYLVKNLTTDSQVLTK